MHEPQAVVDRLLHTTNSHDPDAIAACFADGYENETPVHPARGFRGRDQVRRNWEQIFTFVPDLQAHVLASNQRLDRVDRVGHVGDSHDGTAHEMRGVIVFVVTADVVASARFFLEPVDPADDSTVDDAVRSQVIR